MADPEPRPVVRAGVFPWLPWPLRAMPWWTTPIGAERLAALRIGLALFLLLDVLSSYWPNRQVFFGPDSLGPLENYDWYSQDGRRWWSILRGPNEDLNFTIALFGAIGLAVWIVLDTRTRWLGQDPDPPRPSVWVVLTFALLATYAVCGLWVRTLHDKEVTLDSVYRTWMWLGPFLMTCFAVLIWAVEAWTVYRARDDAAPRPPRTYLIGWYIVAWGLFPVLVLGGYLLHTAEWTDANKDSAARVLLEPWLQSHGMIAASMIAWMIALVCLVLGFQTRLAAVVTWVLSTSFANVHPHIDNAGDTIRGILLFYLMLCPCGAAWSVDSWRQRKQRPAGAAVVVSPWPVCLLFVQLVLMYFLNGVYKAFTPAWREGRTLYFVLNDLTLTRFSFAQLPLTYEMTQFMNWMTLAWELTFPILVLWKPTRIIALLIGVGFHLGIGFTMDLGFFVPYALCLYVPLLPWERLTKAGGTAS